MSVKDLRSLRIAEALLAFQAAVHPELADPDDTDRDPDVRRADDTRPSQGDGLFVKLLDQERNLESQLSICGQAAGVAFPYRLALKSDDGMNVSCVETAVIEENEYGTFCIELGRPTVDGLVTAGRERPLCDQVRVFSYLVRLSCQLVGSRGGVAGLSGDAVGFLRETVRVLRELVRLARLDEGDKPGDGTERSSDGAEPGPERVPPIHAMDSTRREVA